MSVNEFGYLTFGCSNDDNPAAITDHYAYVSSNSFYSRSSTNEQLGISGNNLTRNLENATFICRTESITGEIYETSYSPFRILCKLIYFIYVLNIEYVGIGIVKY